jgi:hypothetical protein
MTARDLKKAAALLYVGGCYVGLRPKRSESGRSQPQLRITKEGDRYLRKMLVQGAHLILNRRGPARIRRSERWWRWPESWRSCCTTCG